MRYQAVVSIILLWLTSPGAFCDNIDNLLTDLSSTANEWSGISQGFMIFDVSQTEYALTDKIIHEYINAKIRSENNGILDDPAYLSEFVHKWQMALKGLPNKKRNYSRTYKWDMTTRIFEENVEFNVIEINNEKVAMPKEVHNIIHSATQAQESFHRQHRNVSNNMSKIERQGEEDLFIENYLNLRHLSRYYDGFGWYPYLDENQYEHTLAGTVISVFDRRDRVLAAQIAYAKIDSDICVKQLKTYHKNGTLLNEVEYKEYFKYKDVWFPYQYERVEHAHYDPNLDRLNKHHALCIQVVDLSFDQDEYTKDNMVIVDAD